MTARIGMAGTEPAALPAFLDGFAGRFEAEPAWLARRRAAAARRFAERGLPTRQDEGWRHTGLAGLSRQRFRPAPALAAVPALPEGGLADAAARLVLLNGRARPELSDIGRLPAGAGLLPLAEALEAEGVADAFDALAGEAGLPLADLSAALADGGWVLRLAPDAVLERPIEIVHLAGGFAEPAAWFPRVLVLAGRGSQATVLERRHGRTGVPYLVVGAAEFVLEEGARLTHVCLQDEATAAFHLQSTVARLGRDARLASFSLLLGAGLSRLDVDVRLAGPGAELGLDGIYALDGRQHADIATAIRHDAPHTASSETFKGVLDGRAHGVFQGLIRVAPQAQKTAGRQLSKTLLLSREAEIDAKPELEILADDVTCNHGAAIGELDPAQLFYLMSRGIPRAEARAMLVEGFLGEALELAPAGDVQELLRRRLGEWLAARHGTEERP